MCVFLVSEEGRSTRPSGWTEGWRKDGHIVRHSWVLPVYGEVRNSRFVPLDVFILKVNLFTATLSIWHRV